MLFPLCAAFSQAVDEEERVIQILDAFKQSIVDNDSENASQLLADEIQILEGSAIETKDEYLSHHFHSDGEFLSAMDRTTESQEVFMQENTAWVTTKSHLHGNFNDRQINLTSLELAVLKKVNDQWKITAIHWSSSARE